jgi:hypothetical protein
MVDSVLATDHLARPQNCLNRALVQGFRSIHTDTLSGVSVFYSNFRATSPREQVQLLAAQAAGFFNQDEGIRSAKAWLASATEERRS